MAPFAKRVTRLDEIPLVVTAQVIMAEVAWI